VIDVRALVPVQPRWHGVPQEADCAAMLPTPFAERVLDLVATIPPGRVLTYGAVAQRLGSRAPRAVGTALARFGGGVPWWRVVRAGGGLPPGHEVAATALLLAEGVTVLEGPDGPRVDLDAHLWTG
jgi:alkylated DNA nucleotide flippase Atl1